MQLIRATVVALAVAMTVAASALAKPQVVQVGNLYLRDNGGISPTRLPKHKPAPISALLDGRIGTTDGSHPPALRSVVADFDRSIRVNAEGLPACKFGRLEARTTAAAKKACPSSIVGSGKGEVEVAFPEQRPFRAQGPIVLFNGGVRGGITRLFIHTYVSVPAPTAVVARVEIRRIRRGRFGLRTIARIPVIAGGSGSVTKFRLAIRRTFPYKGRKRSYLTASCPTGRYFTEGKIYFAEGPTLKIFHAFPCTPKD